MAWIESHQAVGQHPKTIQFAALLRISLPAAVGHLHYLWWWALDFAPTGTITRASAAVVARACLWRGDPDRFWNALVNSGFVDASEEGGVLHDWYERNGRRRDQNRLHRHERRARQHSALGRFNAAEWRELCAQYGHICLGCGASVPLTADHVIPLCRGGTNDIGNIQPLCLPCNSSKGTRSTDYR